MVHTCNTVMLFEISSGHHNKLPQTDGLTQQDLFCHTQEVRSLKARCWKVGSFCRVSEQIYPTLFSPLPVASGALGLEPHHPVSAAGSMWPSFVCLSPNLSTCLVSVCLYVSIPESLFLSPKTFQSLDLAPPQIQDDLPLI